MPSSRDTETVAKFDGTAGLTFDVYEEAVLNAAAGRTDDRGWSLADHLLGVDEGGPNGGPGMAGTEGERTGS